MVPGEDDPYVVKIRQLEHQLREQAAVIEKLAELAGLKTDGKKKQEDAK